MEDSARQKMEALWRCRLEKLPISYEVDFLAMREGSDSVLAWIEYKRRKFVWGQYPTVILSLRKVFALMRYASLGHKAMFVVEDDEEDMRYWPIAEDEVIGWMVERGGRTANTRDDGDIEPVVMIPVARFIRLR